MLTIENATIKFRDQVLFTGLNLLIRENEPCLGFDKDQQQHFRSLIDRIAETGDLGIIYVTHQQETLPACINHTLRLK